MGMNYSIHTAEAFKLPIASQSKSWNLGAENVIARLAFAASLESSEPIELGELLDSKGKEYNSKVLFGGLKATYESMLCLREGITPTHPEFKKYVKAHVDRGLGMILEYSSMDFVDVLERFVPSGE